MKVGLISLGCAKNLVDSEMILGILKEAGIEIVSSPEESDVIIINTCGFIESAKEETINTILEMKEFGKKLIVCGCYAERYKEKLKVEMPFIDRIITLKDYPKIHLILQEEFMDKALKFMPLRYESRMLSTSSKTPYVKISEGCNNRCTYCAIPLIRGGFRSRPFLEIINECKLLIKNGAKEINLISQDTTRYGSDFSPNHESLLASLMEEIASLNGVVMVRALYLYPDEITPELLHTIKNNPKIASYFDIPIQHISSSVLKAMNRRGNETLVKELLYKIRTMIPDAIIRSTLIVGFPGETEADFDQLYHFVEEFQFDRLGVFAYSKEEDTKAFHLDNQIDENIKQDRLHQIMKLQKKIAKKLNKEQIGKVHHTIIEAYDEESKFYYGRSYAFAPDDVDGYIVFMSKVPLSIGDDIDVLITDVFMYDLIGDAQIL
ncbi:MAG: 30S ribosomal protein S12 methylthiotransferase RimO [Firmicutes bacterium]|nr:30S ribosomal protein S12 methylthiotransferase RimO [Bacillota bacterium]